MGKKSSGKTYVSKGIHSNVAKSTRRAVRADYIASGDRLMNQLKAFRKGKRVMVTIKNPNESETNKPYIRVTAKEAGWKSLQKIK